MSRELAEPLPPKETMPTMYNLPYEEADSLGLHNLFHAWQAQLLDETFCPLKDEPTEFFTASKLNVYYNPHLPFQYKRPDWFAVIGLSTEMPQPAQRMSYVLWEQVHASLIVVELLTPGREGDLFGQSLYKANPLLTKWRVYERLMRIPYYAVLSPDDAELRIFTLTGTRYQEAQDHQGRFWIEDIELGLGVWQGQYMNEDFLWLRWYDHNGNWIPNKDEFAEQQHSVWQSWKRSCAQWELILTRCNRTNQHNFKQRLQENPRCPESFCS